MDLATGCEDGTLRVFRLDLKDRPLDLEPGGRGYQVEYSPDGQQLAVTITDIKRAGDYEPWHGLQMQDVRFMRDIYPPRVSLQFTLTDAQGQVIDQGERKLVDSSYLYGGTRLSDTDPLRYEKRLLDDWLRRELRQDHDVAGL